MITNSEFEMPLSEVNFDLGFISFYTVQNASLFVSLGAYDFPGPVVSGTDT